MDNGKNVIFNLATRTVKLSQPTMLVGEMAVGNVLTTGIHKYTIQIEHADYVGIGVASPVWIFEKNI